MKWIIAGGTGFIGRALTQHLEKLGHSITVLSRKHAVNHGKVSYVKWNPNQPKAIAPVLEGADVLVNLCGQSVDTRYTEENKQVLYDSRLVPTRTLGEAIELSENPPSTVFQMSTATIYRDATDVVWNEGGKFGTGFSVDLATKWEEEAQRSFKNVNRLLFLRTSIVLGREGGAYPAYRNLAKMGCRGFGGRSLMFSWIAIEDFCRAIVHLEHNSTLSGVVNMAAEPTRISEFMKLIALENGMGSIANLPTWMINLGAMLIRTEPELLLKSRSVRSSLLKPSGFSFWYEHIEDAVIHLERKLPALPKRAIKNDYGIA